MIWYLNKFQVVIKKQDYYVFPEVDQKEYTFLPEQERVFRDLLDGGGREEEELVSIFSAKTIEQWKEKGVILARAINPENQYSRNASYFWHIGKPLSIPTLAQKKVLVLGLGGIGSHIAWNLAVIGVGILYVLDFDEIEISNLNRQLLYDHDDIGKKKTEVIVEKIKRINPNIQIVPIDCKITSKEMLRGIVRKCSPDCIVKALDSPICFGNWLDNVCEEQKIPYVTAILSGTKQMIGPTYIPEKSSKYSDFFKSEESIERIHGLGPSLGFVMYQMAGELVEETIGILLGNENLLYLDKIVLRQNLTNEVEVLHRYKDIRERKSSNTTVVNLGNVMAILILFLLGKYFGWGSEVFIPVAISYIAGVPLFQTNNGKQAYGFAFVGLFTYVLCNILYLYTSEYGGLLQSVNILGLLSIWFTVLSLGLLVLGFYYTGMMWLKNKLVRRIDGRLN
ncbi:MAG: ThiF family adenylyltransferase [Parasporobacterium sp.]|nr:ThiF family adenylyltransferase [Parasporobacterium sp.]